MGRVKSVYSVADVEAMRWETVKFTQRFAELLGDVVTGGVWMIYGKSGHGKTRFALELAREFAGIGKRVLFVSLEMGLSKALQNELEGAGIRGGTSKMMIKEDVSPEELNKLMRSAHTPDVVIVDSLQYWQEQTGVAFEAIWQMKRRFKKKTFVFLSHVEGKEVEGKLAYQVKRDSMVRILVEGFKAIFKGRGKGGSTGEYVIWAEGAERYWLEDNKI